MKYICILSFFIITSLFGSSIRIINDSPFPLNAEIIGSDGSHKGRVSIDSQKQVTWQDQSSGDSVWSQTPYTVILTCTCKSEDGENQFGILSGVQQGATVTALSATGKRYCKPSKKENSFSDSKETKIKPSPPVGSKDPIWGPP